MSPVNVNIDPATRRDDEAAVTCEPAGDSAAAPAMDNQRPDATIEGDDRTPEEAGYGYGV
jgi:hypothetical protein